MQPKILAQWILAAAIVVGILFFLGSGSNDGSRMPRTPDGELLPSTFLINSRTWVYEPHGPLAEVIESSSVSYYEDAQHSVLEQPRYFSHNGSDQTWAASAQRGEFFHNNGKLELYNKVVLHNDANNAQVQTQAVSVDTLRKVAVAETTVTITQDGDNTLSADGLVADFKTQRLLLKGHVSSVYHPKKKP
ncbi:MAG: LPS export ABC transporter periplasmic protein LptC [Gammaproteobacteria bacterium]|nr:MAG: LPS export ABC transporter periplasmic protein LptC [Gammaproteobacteria bacterium]PIE38568.1 MAG: LPS export ABC transporter periplasmic protein LptC [Gammaproteobacteria bacterium]